MISFGFKDSKKLDGIGLRFDATSWILESMGMPSRSVNVRLPQPMAEAFQRLCESVDLPRAVILRALLQDQLIGKDIDSQIEIVTRQIFKTGRKSARLSGLNARVATRMRAKE